ncbi:MAG: NUDIX domain-containing protein [Candidatus Micrarchaeales archaeon]|nr:NUDIX domain-containing protein [Candidatus Micrarchaeales archaeon]
MLFEFSAGVIAYNYRNGKRRFLFLKRKEFLDVPKGHIEKGESAEDAALRETKEEAGLSVVLDPFFRHEITYWHMRNKEKIKKHAIFFLARVSDDAKVKISFEHDGYEWLTFEESMKRMSFKTQKEVAMDANSYIDKLEAMEALNREYSELPGKHSDWGLSGTFVPGRGNLNAMVMFVGQAPGRSEDEAREPFVGPAGQLLSRLIRRAGLKRESTYITSIVQFFPPDNRLPTEEEARHCMPFLKRQIDIVRPKLIVALGNFASQNLVGIGAVVSNHGRIVKSEEYGCDVFITLHPAAAVRIKSNLPTIEKDFDKLKGMLSAQKA